MEKMKKCPVCGEMKLYAEEGRNALSRYSDTEICSDCATKEALSELNRMDVFGEEESEPMNEDEFNTLINELSSCLDKISDIDPSNISPDMKEDVESKLEGFLDSTDKLIEILKSKE